MTRPRVPLGLEASRTTLNRSACQDLGATLARARSDRGLSVAEVAALLGLSPAQVTALEQVRPEAFYGAEFYGNALKKYLACMGLAGTDVTRVLVEPASPGPSPSSDFHRGRAGAPQSPRVGLSPSPKRAWFAALGTAALATSAVAGWWLIGGRTTSPSATPPSSGRPASAPARKPDTGPVAVPEPAAAGSRPEPATRAVAVSDAALVTPGGAATVRDTATLTAAVGELGSVSVSRRTWVFVRYADNSVDERGLAAGESLRFRGQPIYLAVGSADGTTVIVDGHTIETSTFVVNGQLRIGRSFLGSQIPGG